MTFTRTSLLVCLLAMNYAVPSQAAPSPADFGASVLQSTPTCSSPERADRLRVIATNLAPPACCLSQMRCSQLLATTRINRGHELPHT